MNVDEIAHFLELLDVRGIQVDRSRGWVNAQCPFAPWKHTKGVDSSPSFGVKEVEDGYPVYKCFTCDSSGPLPLLIHSLQWLRDERLGAATNYLLKFPEIFGGEDVDMAQAVERKRVKYDKYLEDVQRKIEIGRPVPQFTLNTLPLLYDANNKQAEDSIDYLNNERGITEQAIRQYGLRLWLDAYKMPVIVFPIVSRKSGEIVDLWGRWTGSKKFRRLTHDMVGSPYAYFAPHLWFGWQFFDPAKPVLLVEGAFDLLRIKSLGMTGANVWASLGTPSKDQIAQVYSDQKIILGFDADEAGSRMAMSVYKEIKDANVSVINWAKIDPKNPFKDAGELKNREQLKKAFSFPVLHPFNVEKAL